MNIKRNFLLSSFKSAVRILGCIAFSVYYNYAMVNTGVQVFLSCLVLAELINIIENILDY